MNEYELQRVIQFVKRTRDPWLGLVPAAEPDAAWNIVTHLISCELARQPVTLSALVDVTGLPYATALRRVHRMIDEGHIVKRSLKSCGKRFTLHPGPALMEGFETYARHMKCLIAETFGRPVSVEDESEFYFGGRVADRRGPNAPGTEPQPARPDSLRFLLHDDNYFGSMRNMWVDFRSNLASRRDFVLQVLPDLYRTLRENAQREVSAFDVVTVNMPWLAEFAGQGLLRPLDDLIEPDTINVADFQLLVWETGSWAGRTCGVPIYVTVELLATRRDLFEERALAAPRTFDDVITAGRALHAPERERFGIVWNAAAGMPLAHSFMFFLGACGGRVAEAPGASDRPGTRIGIDGDAGRAVLDYMHRLVEISPPDILTLEWKRGLQLFMQGHSAMSYVWTMRGARFEYDLLSQVKKRVAFQPHPAGPGGSNLSPLGGFLLAVPANLPEDRARRAFAAIASMVSPEAMRAHVKNGFPIVPRFSIAADPEVLAGSPLIGIVDKLARRNLISTAQRPRLPGYAAIEQVLGTVLHRALTGEMRDAAALRQAQDEVDRILEGVVGVAA